MEYILYIRIILLGLIIYQQTTGLMNQKFSSQASSMVLIVLIIFILKTYIKPIIV